MSHLVGAGFLLGIGGGGEGGREGPSTVSHLVGAEFLLGIGGGGEGGREGPSPMCLTWLEQGFSLA